MTGAEPSGIKILLVEDNHDDAAFVERLIHEFQVPQVNGSRNEPIGVAAVDHVDRLADGVEQVQVTEPDVVLLDLMLPDSRGLETVDRMVECAPMVPVVVLTGQDERDVGTEAIQRGAQEYLSKDTVTGESILRTIRYAIERMQNRQRLRDRNHRLSLLNRLLRKDLQNDISMIVGLVDQLRDDEGESDVIETALDAAHHAAELTDTAADVVDVIASDELESGPVDIIAALNGAVEAVERNCDVEVTVNLPPKTEQPVVVSGSPMLGLAFERLLSNAVTRTDSDPFRPTTTVEVGPGQVSVSISATPEPLPAYKRLRVEPGEAAPHSRMDTDLYLVASVIEALDGTIEVAKDYPYGADAVVALERIHHTGSEY